MKIVRSLVGILALGAGFGAPEWSPHQWTTGSFAQQKQVFEHFSKEMRKAVRKLGERNQEEERRAREKAERRAQRPCGQG